jgi:hypothetical protein
LHCSQVRQWGGGLNAADTPCLIKAKNFNLPELMTKTKIIEVKKLSKLIQPPPGFLVSYKE